MSERRMALVTGASSGIGAAFADVLGEQGWDLVLVARRRERLEEKAADLHSRFGVQVEVLDADLAETGDLRGVERRLEAGDIALLVNNAGIGDIAPFADQERDIHERMIAINITALTRLAHAAVAGMPPQAGGMIINVASGFAFDFMPGASVYAASKAYVVQLTRVLHAELAGEGLRFQALVPGLTRTELGGAAETDFFANFPPEMVASPETIARASLIGLELGELICVPWMEDTSQVALIEAQYRQLGKSPEHNRPASRYALD